MAIKDKDIISAIMKSPQTGFRMLMKKYQEPVYWHIRRMVVLHDDAQDATQETFIRIYKSLEQCRDSGSFRSWIYRIATNEALRAIGRRRNEMVSMDSESTGASLIKADEYVDYDDIMGVNFQKAILALPPKQQLAFNLRYYDDMSFDEIAKVAGSTAASAKVNYHIAKEKITKYMKSIN